MLVDNCNIYFEENFDVIESFKQNKRTDFVRKMKLRVGIIGCGNVVLADIVKYLVIP